MTKFSAFKYSTKELAAAPLETVIWLEDNRKIQLVNSRPPWTNELFFSPFIGFDKNPSSSRDRSECWPLSMKFNWEIVKNTSITVSVAFSSKLFSNYELQIWKVHFDQKHGHVPLFKIWGLMMVSSQVTYQVLLFFWGDRFSNIEPFLLAKGVLWPLVPNNYILLSTPLHWIWTTCWILH